MLLYELVINGLDHAWQKEFGCHCARCLDQARTANTSVSLLGWCENSLEQHILVDAGGGVCESLIAHPDLMQQPRLDTVLLTHWHPDHVADLNRIVVGFGRSSWRERHASTRPYLWMREGSRMWLERQQPNVLKQVNLISSLEYIAPGHLLEPLETLGLDLVITPVTIAHSSADLYPPFGEERLATCAGFIVETGGFRTVLLWDLDATNLWLENPNEAQQEAFDAIAGCDLLLIDCNTWSYHRQASGEPTSHVSFSLVQRFALVLKPKRTVLMHISGHEDAIGDGFGWTNEIWQLEATKAWQIAGLTGDVIVPRIGQRFAMHHLDTALEAVELEAAL
jgi:ribonuclease BN (tRNA processing enzyme)